MTPNPHSAAIRLPERGKRPKTSTDGASVDITVVVTTGRGDAKTTYKLDGTEMKETVPMGESRAKVSWDGATLVVNRAQNVTTPQGAFEITSKETYSVSGGILTLVTTRNSPMGNTSRKTVFTKG